MGCRLAIIHTTPVTVEPLKQLALRLIGDCEVINFVDDSILPRLLVNDGDVNEVKHKLLQYAKYAEAEEADVVLNACSSVGETVAEMRKELSIPVVRIDEAMAETAVNRGNTVGVAATLSTTLRPTVQLLKEKATARKAAIEVQPLLADDAYRALAAGDRQEHDRLVAESLADLAKKTDVVVLAQASMAQAVERLPAAIRGQFLSSPESGMKRVKQTLEEGRR
ncbi:MAG TPA: aspartate/glutamate racemase family protein [Bacillales bacterium]|nr:aspartate/glutamate racemase family protein [Bacillales bacterium]